MTRPTGGVDRGRQSFTRSAWADAYRAFSAADAATPLAAADLELFAQAAYLIGMDDQSTTGWARAYQEWVRSGDSVRAVRAAFWLAFGLLNRGELVQAGGWIERAQRLLDDYGLDCVEHGMLHYLVGLRRTFEGDASAGREAFAEATTIGERFNDPQLTTLARIGLGRCLIYLRQAAAGLALLDEAMIAVTSGELPELVIGDAYCTVIDGCQEVLEIRRSQVWTAELSRWCDQRPSIVAYRGQCLIHRAEILQLRGAWPEAMVEARRACERLAKPSRQYAIGAAWYRTAELHRLRGEVEQAESAYRQASRFGHEPQPGLAQLRLLQGRTQVAAAAIRRWVDEQDDPVSKSRSLPIYVEIMLAVGNNEAAAEACRELEQISAGYRSDMLDAVVHFAIGSVDLADHDAAAALVSLRHAARIWQELDAPYEAARARVLVGQACQALGDQDTAELELAAAGDVFARLNAAPDLARVHALHPAAAQGESHGLTPRELQVLRLLSTGDTNKSIAAKLVLSDRTVDRHVSSILTKLGVPSRAAATAFAYEHHLV